MRPYVLHADHCARRRAAQREQDQQRTDRARLDLAALLDISEPVEVPA